MHTYWPSIDLLCFSKPFNVHQVYWPLLNRLIVGHLGYVLIQNVLISQFSILKKQNSAENPDERCAQHEQGDTALLLASFIYEKTCTLRIYRVISRARLEKCSFLVCSVAIVKVIGIWTFRVWDKWLLVWFPEIGSAELSRSTI